MIRSEEDKLLAHLELQTRTLAAMVTLAQLDDSKTDMLLPEVRSQLMMMNETLDTLGIG